MKQFVKKYIPNSWLEIYRNIKPSWFFRKLSYAQCGEDLILEHLLRGLVKSGMTTKDRRIIDKLEENGYFEYAFTGINSIFVDKKNGLIDDCS